MKNNYRIWSTFVGKWSSQLQTVVSGSGQGQYQSKCSVGSHNLSFLLTKIVYIINKQQIIIKNIIFNNGNGRKRCGRKDMHSFVKDIGKFLRTKCSLFFLFRWSVCSFFCSLINMIIKKNVIRTSYIEIEQTSEQKNI